MIKREQYMKKIRPFINKDIVKVMTGMRRSGKSIMLKLIGEELLENGINKEQILSINFESKLLTFDKNINGAFNYVKKFIEKDNSKKYLFFDEIQDLKDWEELVNALMIDFDVDIYITGSNAKLLSGELATYLAGRYIEIVIYPFSYLEVIDILKETNQYVDDQSAFIKYLKYGGLPGLYQFPLEEIIITQYLEDIYQSTILKDIISRYKIRDVYTFEKILLYFISSIGHTYSAVNIRKYLKNEGLNISLETIYNYIQYCKDACLLYLSSRLDVVGKQTLKFQEKIYLTDHGVREAIYGNNQRDIDQVLENIVYIELLRKGYKVFIGKNDKYEVDFVAIKKDEKIYIQVSYLLAVPETIEREFRSLETIMDNYPKYVISMDEINRGRNGIKHFNIIEFLKLETL